MEPLKGEAWVRAFRATDAFAMEAYRASGTLPKRAPAAELAAEIRRTAIRSGGALVAASASEPGGEQERRHLGRARASLLEGRYYLHLARRFGLLDARGYRSLTSRQDAARRLLDALLRPEPAAPL